MRFMTTLVITGDKVPCNHEKAVNSAVLQVCRNVSFFIFANAYDKSSCNLLMHQTLWHVNVHEQQSGKVIPASCIHSVPTFLVPTMLYRLANRSLQDPRSYTRMASG